MSLVDAALPWSAEQQEWLAALGYTVYASGSVTEVVESEAATAAMPAPETATAAPVTARPQARVAPSLDEAAQTRTAATARPAARPRAAGARLPDRLHFALIRASGCNPNAEGAAEIFAQWPASAELRGNPSAKRALWPRLRALRRPVP